MTRDSLRRAATAQATTPEERAEDERRRVPVAGEIVTVFGTAEEQLHTLRSALMHTTRAWDNLFAGVWQRVVGERPHGRDGIGELFVVLDKAADERRRFITANAELALLTVRQGYALRVLRGAALALVGAVGERDRAEAAAAHDDTGASALAHTAAQTAVQAAFTALHEALDETAEESKAAETAHQQFVAERDRLQRACDEGGERNADALTALASLKPLASRAYRTITLPAGVDRAKHLAEPIRPDFDADNDEAPRLVLSFDLGGMIPAEGRGQTPWQASVEYDGGMGAVPVIAGNACATPIEAMDSLRAELEAEGQKPLRDDEGSDD